jgi:hypothetical protein
MSQVAVAFRIPKRRLRHVRRLIEQHPDNDHFEVLNEYSIGSLHGYGIYHAAGLITEDLVIELPRPEGAIKLMPSTDDFKQSPRFGSVNPQQLRELRKAFCRLLVWLGESIPKWRRRGDKQPEKLAYAYQAIESVGWLLPLLDQIGSEDLFMLV